MSDIHTPYEGYKMFLTSTFSGYNADTNEIAFAYSPTAIKIDLTNHLKEFADALLEFVVTSQEQELIQSRFGMITGHWKTYKEVGQPWSYSESHVRNMIKKIQRKIRHKTNVTRVIGRLSLEVY